MSAKFCDNAGEICRLVQITMTTISSASHQMLKKRSEIHWNISTERLLLQSMLDSWYYTDVDIHHVVLFDAFKFCCPHWRSVFRYLAVVRKGVLSLLNNDVHFGYYRMLLALA